MEHTQTISGLLEHRRQVAGDVAFHREKAAHAAALLGSVDQVLRSLGYEGSDILAPLKAVQTAGVFRRGEPRIIMAALREAPDGLTVDAMARAICRERDWQTDDAKWMTALRAKIGRALGKKRGKGQVTNAERGGTFYWYAAPLVPTITPPAASSPPTGG